MIVETLVLMCLAGGKADRRCTPGEHFPRVTRQQVCTSGWATAHRHVLYSDRRAMFASYGIDYAQHARYEFDHLLPLELGGDNSRSNLWPELLSSARVKDNTEDKLHGQLCAGETTLRHVWAVLRAGWRT